MSHVALQRVVVRMLWDPEFVARVYATPEVALAADELDPDEIAWLTKPDRRAWATDPQRRARTLHGLLEEFPASGALAANHERGLFVLDRFFSSTTFHAAVRDGFSLALAFGAYLAREVSGAVSDPRVRALASVEGALASIRRSPKLPPGMIPFKGKPAAGRVTLRPDAALFDAPAGSAALLAEITRRLALHPGGIVAAIAERACDLRALPALGADHQPVTLLALPSAAAPGAALPQSGADAFSLEELPAALAALLRAAAGGALAEDLLAIARREGADPGEDREILDGLIADGLLIAL